MIQCLDGLGGSLVFQWYNIDSNFREYLDHIKLGCSYTGRAAKAVVNAIDTAEPLKNKDINECSDVFRDALIQIRIGLEPIKLACKDYQAAEVVYNHLFGMRDHVDALLSLLGVDSTSIIAEAKQQIIRPDALENVVSKTVSCADAGFKLYQHGGGQYNELLIVELKTVNGIHHSDLSSITRPHRLKTFIIKTQTRKFLIQKPTLYFAWGDQRETTLCLGRPMAVKTSSGKPFKLMKVKRGWWSDRENENLKNSMLVAEELLTKADRLELVEHRHG